VVKELRKEHSGEVRSLLHVKSDGSMWTADTDGVVIVSRQPNADVLFLIMNEFFSC
jgi:hypothetical protein